MERAVALKKLTKMLGKSLGYRVDPKAPNAEERDAARVQAADLSAAARHAREAMEAREKELLSDPYYLELVAAAKAAREAHNRMTYTAHHHYKITVGRDRGMFFHIEAQGDSWEEVIEKLSKERVAA